MEVKDTSTSKKGFMRDSGQNVNSNEEVLEQSTGTKLRDSRNTTFQKFIDLNNPS